MRSRPPMFALGTKRTFRSRSAASVFGGKANTRGTLLNVRSWPKADIGGGNILPAVRNLSETWVLNDLGSWREW